MPEMTPAQSERYRVHYEEFLSRGLSATEATRLAQAVLARETPGASTTPLTLSSAEAAKYEERESARIASKGPESADPLVAAIAVHVAKLDLAGQGTVTLPAK